MRLGPTEKETIKNIIFQFSPDGEIYLHGSRINDDLKGGDIDLFLLVPDADAQRLKARKHYIEAELSAKLREQRIDLTILSLSESQIDHFFISSDKIKLWPKSST